MVHFEVKDLTFSYPGVEKKRIYCTVRKERKRKNDTDESFEDRSDAAWKTDRRSLL